MKIYAYAAAILALCGLLVWGVHIKKRADQADAAEHALTVYQAQVAARDKQAADMQAKDAETRKALADRLAATDTVITQLRANPPKQAVKYVQLPGEACPQLHLDPEWVSSYNAASDASRTAAMPHTN